MSARPSSEGARRARLGRPLAGALATLALLALILLAAGATACGSASSDIGPYLGVWQRIDAGAPNPDFTLTVATQGDGAAVTFADQSHGLSQTVAATVEDGYLACTLPTGDDPAPTPASGVSAGSDLQLSVDESGQLVVDLVLADGSTEPTWVYDRATQAAPSASVEP